MSNRSIHRRDFLKLMGMGSAALSLDRIGHKTIARTANGHLVESPSEFGGFTVERLGYGKYPYEYDSQLIKQMSEKSTTFSP